MAEIKNMIGAMNTIFMSYFYTLHSKEKNQLFWIYVNRNNPTETQKQNSGGKNRTQHCLNIEQSKMSIIAVTEREEWWSNKNFPT